MTGPNPPPPPRYILLASDEEHARWTALGANSWQGYRIARTVWDLVDDYGEDIGVAWDRDMADVGLPSSPPARVIPRPAVVLLPGEPHWARAGRVDYYQASLMFGDDPSGGAYTEAVYDPRQRRWIRLPVVLPVMSPAYKIKRTDSPSGRTLSNEGVDTVADMVSKYGRRKF